MIEALRNVIKRRHYPLEVMLICVRWYAAYPLCLRHIEEMMSERGMRVDHATVHRWAIKILSVLAAVFRQRKRPVGTSWRMDETYIKVAGQWKYLYRAVDREGDTVDFSAACQDRPRCCPAISRASHRFRTVCPRRSPSTRAAPTPLPHPERQCRLRRDHRTASVQVPQQHRRAGPPGHQAHRSAHARLQVLPLRTHPHCRHRNRAHDPQRAA